MKGWPCVVAPFGFCNKFRVERYAHFERLSAHVRYHNDSNIQVLSAEMEDLSKCTLSDLISFEAERKLVKDIYSCFYHLQVCCRGTLEG